MPGGDFVMGTDPLYREEGPPRWVFVSPFRLQAHEVTNSQFAAFVAGIGTSRLRNGAWAQRGSMKAILPKFSCPGGRSARRRHGELQTAPDPISMGARFTRSCMSRSPRLAPMRTGWAGASRTWWSGHMPRASVFSTRWIPSPAFGRRTEARAPISGQVHFPSSTAAVTASPASRRRGAVSPVSPGSAT